MKFKMISVLAMCVCLWSATAANAQFNDFNNQGLVGVGRIPANSFDTLGPNVDTLGGVFSAMAFDRNSLERSGNTYSGTLFGLPDRGFGDGAQDYVPRIQRFAFSVTPYYGTAPITAQNQITLQNNQTIRLAYPLGELLPAFAFFTGFDGNDTASQMFPRSLPSSLGQGRRSLDAEGLALRTQDGGFWVSDEYGPFIYRFNSAGLLQQTLPIPAAILPKTGAAFPRPNNFTGGTAPTVGRNNNRGIEGLSLTPDEKRLVAMLQSPTVQDSGGASANNSLNTRILVYDVEPGSPTQNTLVGEYVYILTNQGSAAGRSTPISALYALNGYQFLILERDNIGLGGNDGAPRYKKVNLADVSAATNIAGTGYDLESGAPGALQLPATTLPAEITPTARQDFVNLIDAAQLAKFGLNANAVRDQNSLSEKWEGLSLVPLNESNAPNDYLLLVGNDNDFKAATVFHNGVSVGTNAVTVDTMILAYRVTLPASRETAVHKRDFDGDAKSDLTVFRNGTWFTLNGNNQSTNARQFGLGTDKLAPADYDGDDKTDLAVYRNGVWYILNSQSNTVRAVSFGLADDIPAPADYDGDGKADIAVHRRSNGFWYFINSFNGVFRAVSYVNFNDALPQPGDYDGDSKADIAVWRPSNGGWYILPSTSVAVIPQQIPIFFGESSDLPMPGDYDGDGKTDIAVFRPSNGFWYQLRSSRTSANAFFGQQFGQNGDVPVTGDYDGDGKNDLAVYRNGVWFILPSLSVTAYAAQWGLPSDMPVQ